MGFFSALRLERSPREAGTPVPSPPGAQAWLKGRVHISLRSGKCEMETEQSKPLPAREISSSLASWNGGLKGAGSSSAHRGAPEDLSRFFLSCTQRRSSVARVVMRPQAGSKPRSASTVPGQEPQKLTLGDSPPGPRRAVCPLPAPPAHRHRDRAAHPLLLALAVDHVSGASRTQGQSSGRDAPGFTTWPGERGGKRRPRRRSQRESSTVKRAVRGKDGTPEPSPPPHPPVHTPARRAHRPSCPRVAL